MSTRKRVLRSAAVVAALAVIAAGCSDAGEDARSIGQGQEETNVIIDGAQPPVGAAAAVPWHGLDGNRIVTGTGPLDLAEPLDIAVGGRLDWLVGFTVAGGPAWLAVDDTGVMSLIVADRADPTVSVVGSGYEDIPPILAAGSPASVPQPIPNSGSLPITVEGVTVAVLGDGLLAVGDAPATDIRVLPDARVVFDGEGGALVLGGATDRYRHAVLGDVLEASAVYRVDLAAGTVELVFEVDDREVIEGTAPIWADLDEDGEREIVVTISDAAGGARLAVLAADGLLVAESAPIGRASRWRHQIAAAPIGPEREVEVVDVLTPHLGGVVEFFRVDGAELVKTASIGGYTSHFIGSRNLSLPVVADTDGDGRLEVVLVTQDRTRVAGIGRTDTGAEELWSAALDGRLSSNLSLVTLEDGSLALAAARRDGVIRVWFPAGR